MCKHDACHRIPLPMADNYVAIKYNHGAEKLSGVVSMETDDVPKILHEIYLFRNNNSLPENKVEVL